MTHSSVRALPIAMLLFAAATGCGGSDAPAAAGEGEARVDANASESQASGRTAPAELTAADLNAWERGMKAEIAAVRAAGDRAASASTPQERADAASAGWERATIPQGAETAGLAVDRYRQVRETVNEVFRTLDFQGKIDGPLSIDLSRVDPATKERLARDPFADLPGNSAAVLREQMDRLLPVWIEYVTLTAVAG